MMTMKMRNLRIADQITNQKTAALQLIFLFAPRNTPRRVHTHTHTHTHTGDMQGHALWAPERSPSTVVI